MGASASKSSEGFHVLMIQENSPAEEAGLEPFFDYLVAINGVRLDQEDTTLVDQMKAGVNKECKLTVYNSKTQEMRETKIVPTDNWGGVGLLGARIRFCSFEGASDNVWHILTVYPNSPAEKANLQANTDYIIATPDSILHDQASFAELVEQSIDKPLRLYVYNSTTDKTREVTIVPNKNWGGKGSLGCDVGYGYLHRIPNPKNRTSHSDEHCNDPNHSHSHSHPHSHSHGHDDHGHSHSHGHGHSHSHGHSHDDHHEHGDDCGHDHAECEEEHSECEDDSHSHSHGNDHGHSHSHGQDHGHSHSHGHAHSHGKTSPVLAGDAGEIEVGGDHGHSHSHGHDANDGYSNVSLVAPKN